MMRKAISLLIFLALVAAAVKPIFNQGFPYTHDGENHLARFANFKIAVKEGQLPPRFAPNLLNHYGYPVFNYNYPLANILSLPFSMLRISYELTFKIILAASVLAGAVGSIFLARSVIRETAWYVPALAFLSMPYLTATMFVRGSIGEILAMGLLPWVILGIERPLRSLTDHRSLLLRSLLLSAFFLSHNSTVLYFTPLLVLHAVFVSRDQRPLLSALRLQLVPLVVGTALSLWFWIPAWFERSAVVVSSAQNQHAWQDHFVTVSQWFSTSVRFGFSLPGMVDTMSFGLGFMTISTIALSLALVVAHWLQSRPKSFTAGWYLLIAGLALIGQLAISRPIWQFLPLVGFIQFPWRLQLILVVAMPVLASALHAKFNRWGRIAMLLGLLLQLALVAEFRPVDYFHRLTIDYDMFSQSSTTQNENRSTQFTYEEIADWRPQPTVQTGQTTVTVDSWTGSQRTYNAAVATETLMTEPTMYFPGWQTNIINLLTNQRQLATYIFTPETAGRIAYNLSPGNYRVTTRFTQNTPARWLGNLASLLAFVTLISYSGWREFQDRRRS